MSRPTSAEQVCNLSFDLLRHTTAILSLSSPESDEESLAARWYDATRCAVLGAFPWNFAKRRASIPLDPTYSECAEYGDAYILPSDYVELVFVGEDIDDDYETDYAVEGDRLLINNNEAESLDICYIWDFGHVSKFDPVFLLLLIGELAVVFGNSVTGLNKGIKSAVEFRDRWELKARSKNAQVNPMRVRCMGELTKRRNKILGSTNASDGVHLF